MNTRERWQLTSYVAAVAVPLAVIAAIVYALGPHSTPRPRPTPTPTATAPRPFTPAEARYLAAIRDLPDTVVGPVDDADVVATGHRICSALDNTGQSPAGMVTYLEQAGVTTTLAVVTVAAATHDICPRHRLEISPSWTTSSPQTN